MLKTKYKATGELRLFKWIWSTTNRRSWISGRSLGVFSVNFFAHVLSKKQFPHFRLYLGNIKILSSTEHNLLDAGTQEQRIFYAKRVKSCNWDRIYTLQGELRELYDRTFPAKVGAMIMKYSKEEVREQIASLNSAYLDTFTHKD